MPKLYLIPGCFLSFFVAGTALAEPWYAVECPSGYSVVKKAGPGHQYQCKRTVIASRECAYVYQEGACPLASPGGGPAIPCKLGVLPNKPNKFSCVWSPPGGNPGTLACSPSTPACPPGYLLNTSGKELAKDCSNKRVGKADRRKTCYKKTAETATKETDYKKPAF